MKLNVKEADKSVTDSNGVTFIYLNENSKYFIVCKHQEFYIFKCSPFKKVVRIGNRVSVLSLLKSSNIIGVVLTQNLDELILLDLKTKKHVLRLQKNERIISTIVHLNFFIIIHLKSVEIYDNEKRLLCNYDTISNPKGLCSINKDLKQVVVAFPHTKQGSVMITIQTENGNNREMLVDAFSAKNEWIDSICLDRHGKKLAVGSNRGRLKVFDCDSSSGKEKGELFTEYNRGNSTVSVTSLSFSYDTQYLLCTSANASVHVFSLVKTDNPVSRLSIISSFGFSKHFSLPMSLFTFNNKKDQNLKPPAIAKWILEDKHKRKAVVVTGTGWFYILKWMAEERQFEIIERKRFLDFLV